MTRMKPKKPKSLALPAPSSRTKRVAPSKPKNTKSVLGKAVGPLAKNKPRSPVNMPSPAHDNAINSVVALAPRAAVHPVEPLATPAPQPVIAEPAMLTYSKDAVAWFRGIREDPLRHLSNLCGGHPIYWPPVRDPHYLWCSTEQLYLSAHYSTKAWRRPRNHPSAEGNVRVRIRMQKTAREAYKTQRCARSLVRPDWTGPNDVQLKAMLWVLELKLYFNHYRGFGRELVATGDRPIVEISAHDDFWGAKEVSPGVLVGHNHLGRLLMVVRDRASAILDGDFTYPEGFLLD
jgi:predicted NAD-dependent protein-ADP-ribosyltransferase YbiA (DUF1768 family)